MFTMIFGGSIALIGFFIAMYNMYSVVKNAEEAMYKPKKYFLRYIIAISLCGFGGSVFLFGAIRELLKLFA